MTSEDVLKFCDKGNHKYREVDVLTSIKPKSALDFKAWILFQCDNCPSKWVKRV